MTNVFYAFQLKGYRIKGKIFYFILFAQRSADENDVIYCQEIIKFIKTELR